MITEEKEIFEMAENIAAPVKVGDKVGRVVYRLGDKEIGESDIVAAERIDKINFFGLLIKILSKMAIC